MEEGKGTVWKASKGGSEEMADKRRKTGEAGREMNLEGKKMGTWRIEGMQLVTDTERGERKGVDF